MLIEGIALCKGVLALYSYYIVITSVTLNGLIRREYNLSQLFIIYYIQTKEWQWLTSSLCGSKINNEWLVSQMCCFG